MLSFAYWSTNSFVKDASPARKTLEVGKIGSGSKVEKVEIFYTHHKSYRAYVKIKVSKENVDIILEEIKADKRLTQLSKKPNKLKSKVKEVLKYID